MEDVIYNSYEEDVAIYGDFELPVPTYIIDTKIDFSIIVALLLRSNSNIKEDVHRYIDYSKINKKEICDECKISMKTLERRFKYLEENNIITAKNTKRGLTYYINYSKDGKFYVTIQHRILKALQSSVSKNVIKTYIVLKIQCEYCDNKNPMTNAFLCSLIGLSANNERNLTNMGLWTNTLAGTGFIEKIQHRVYDKNEDGKNVISKVNTYYKINSLEEWEKKRKKGVISL